jgi:hypothetical protein
MLGNIGEVIHLTEEFVLGGIDRVETFIFISTSLIAREVIRAQRKLVFTIRIKVEIDCAA